MAQLENGEQNQNNLQTELARRKLFLMQLFKGAKISLMETLQILQIYRQRHGLTDAAFQDILYLMHNFILPDGHALPLDLRTFNKRLENECPQKVIYRNKNYIVYSIREQLTEILESKVKIR